MYVDPTGDFAISALVIGAIIGACIGFGTAAYIDSKDGQMFNGDVKWYDYLGATALGGVVGAGVGAVYMFSKGNGPRIGHNHYENKQFRQLCRKHNLTKTEEEKLHRYISHQNYIYIPK